MQEIVDNFIKSYFKEVKEEETVVANKGNIKDFRAFASDLGHFLYQLHHLKIDEKRSPNFENSFAGSNLKVFEAEILQFLQAYKSVVPVKFLQECFEKATKRPWKKEPVWVHGALTPENIRIVDGRISYIAKAEKAVVGDPACDLLSAWSLLDSRTRKIFFGAADMDKDTIARAQMWAVLNALRTYNSEDIDLMIQARDSLIEVLKDLNYQGEDELYDERAEDSLDFFQDLNEEN